MVIKMKTKNCRIEVKPSYYCKVHQMVLGFTQAEYNNISKLFAKGFLQLSLLREEKSQKTARKIREKGLSANTFPVPGGFL